MMITRATDISHKPIVNGAGRDVMCTRGQWPDRTDVGLAVIDLLLFVGGMTTHSALPSRWGLAPGASLRLCRQPWWKASAPLDLQSRSPSWRAARRGANAWR